ncbi:MAG: hypothetical protein R3A44_10285 [Caldilineaceae bacterium]
MKHTILLIACIGVGFIGWRIGGELSPDAMGMAIGMLFGVMAGIPTALLVLASQRRESTDQRPAERPQQQIEQHYHIGHLSVTMRASEAVQPVERVYRIIGSDE